MRGQVYVAGSAEAEWDRRVRLSLQKEEENRRLEEKRRAEEERQRWSRSAGSGSCVRLPSGSSAIRSREARLASRGEVGAGTYRRG